MQIPAWRTTPEPRFISIKIIGKDDWSGQIVAEFNAGGQTYAITVDEDIIDLTSREMPVLIIADVGTNNYLIDLPGESLSAGSRILVGSEDLNGRNGR